MYRHRDDSKRTTRAPAKLNLFLEVTGRRDDGFHDLETLIVPIRLCDWLTLTPVPPTDDELGKLELDVIDCRFVRSPPNAEHIPANSENLALRAVELLQQRSGCRWGARIELVKRIPVAAGLGGGSSDGAAALRLANRAWHLNWPNERLVEVAAELGSDVPFFIKGGAAICRGRGERVEPIRSGRPLYVVIVKPPAGLSTADVYRAHDAQPPTSVMAQSRLNRLAEGLARGRWRVVGQYLYNRLQPAAASLTPWVDQARMIFEELGCVAHQLAGSGSAYFGICRNAQHARRLAAAVRTRQLGLVYATRSCQ